MLRVSNKSSKITSQTNENAIKKQVGKDIYAGSVSIPSKRGENKLGTIGTSM